MRDRARALCLALGGLVALPSCSQSPTVLVDAEVPDAVVVPDSPAKDAAKDAGPDAQTTEDAAPDAAQESTWALLLWSDEESLCNACAVGPQGDVWVAGEFASKLRIAGQEFDSHGGQDAFVARLSSQGSLKWVKSFGSSAFSIALDPSGEALVVGNFEGEAMFGTEKKTAVGQHDAFVARLTASGDVSWVKTLAGTELDALADVALDSAGNVYVTGTLKEMAQLFGGPGAVSVGYSDALVAKLSAAGQLVWWTTDTGEGAANGSRMVVAADGSSYVMGRFAHGPAIFGEHSLAPVDGHDVFFAGLTPGGEWAWARRAGGTGEDWSGGLALGAGGALYVAANYAGDGTLVDQPISNPDKKLEALISRFSTDGSLSWMNTFGGPGYDTISDLSVDEQGRLFAGGFVELETSLEREINTPRMAAYVARLSTTDGSPRASKVAEGSGRSSAACVRPTTGGNLVVAGSFVAETKLGDTVLSAAPTADWTGFVWRTAAP